MQACHSITKTSGKGKYSRFWQKLIAYFRKLILSGLFSKHMEHMELIKASVVYVQY